MNCIYSHEGGAYCDKHDHGAVTVGCCGEESCPDREVLTNADRIRAMSDEELATFFGTLPCCPPGNADELCFPDNTCGADTKMMVKCWANWLKSPVEEVDE